jgi:Protein of unknown function (DUF3102)
MRKAKKTKGPRRKATALDRIAARLRKILRRETTSVIEAGKLLIESRSRKHLRHGEWKPWLAANFSLSYQTALNYCAAARYVERKQKSNVGHFDFENLTPSVLYVLAEGHYKEEEDEILAATLKGRVGVDAVDAICTAIWERTRPAAPPTVSPAAPPNKTDDQSDDAAKEDAEIEAMLDGPPPPVPPPAPNPPPTDFALRDFNEAIGVLKRLMTKPSAQFAGTIHSANELVTVEDFIRSVRERTEAPR